MPLRIDEAQWECHRHEIHTLYLGHNMSLKDVMFYMKKHNFDATKAQYERHFKIWNFRKNLNNVEWKFVHHRMEKRKRDDKESALRVDGIEIPNKRIKKEISRHSRPILSTPWPGQRYISAASPQSPGGISVFTPFEEVSFAFNLENLPWFQFQGFVQSQVEINHGLVGLDAGRQSPWSHQQLFNSILPDQPNSLAQTNETQMSTGITAPPFSSLFSGLPLIMAEPDIDIVDNIRSAYSHMQTALQAECCAGLGCMTFSEGPLEPTNRHIMMRLINYGMYLASNNMLGYNHTNGLLQLVINNKQESTLASLLSVKMPTTEAFADHIFGNAVRMGDMNVVRILLEGGSNPNRRAQSGGMPLGIAICNLNIELARILLHAGANVNYVPVNTNTLVYCNMTAIQLAARFANVEMASLLLNAGADIDAVQSCNGCQRKCGEHDTALQLAMRRGNIELVRFLLAKSADANAPPFSGMCQGIYDDEEVDDGTCACDNDGKVHYDGCDSGRRGTALQAAAENGNIELLRTLLDAQADVSANVLAAAASKGNIEHVRILLDVAADVNALAADDYGRTALQAAAGNGKVELVQILLDAGADVNALGTGYPGTALQAAARNGKVELVRILLDAGAEANAPAAVYCGRTTLQAAARNRKVERDRIQLDEGADVNAPAAGHPGTALQAAAGNGKVELVRILLDAGADVNAPAADYPGTALQASAENGNVELVRILLDAGADVNAPAAEWFGRTALQAAVEKGNLELVRILLDAGADVNALVANRYGRTAPEAAVVKGNIELVQILLDAGADVNTPATEYLGRSVLQAAAEKGNIELVTILLDAGADVNTSAAYSRGITALQGAAINGHIGVAFMLLKAGADVNAAPAIKHGRTALEGAVEHGRLDMVQLLLGAGADNYCVDGIRFESAAELAEDEGHCVIAKLLRNYSNE